MIITRRTSVKVCLVILSMCLSAIVQAQELNWQINASGTTVHIPTGPIGINTSDPDTDLTVNGSIHCSRYRLEVSNVPDYVFDVNYSLRSLKELELYIDKCKHLPGVKPGHLMDAEGLKVEKTHMILLEKIEELTLYLLDQDKRISQLKKQLTKK